MAYTYMNESEVNQSVHPSMLESVKTNNDNK